MKFIGIDIGTTSVCGVVIDARNGKLAASTTLPNDSWVRSDHPWERMQRPDRIAATAERITASFLKRFGNVAGIGVTGQMHGILYVDSAGRTAGPLFTWQDGRAALPFKTNRTYAGELARITGYPTAPGFGLATHFYNVKNRLAPVNAAFLCTIADYIAMRLSRQKRPSIDPTNAASLGTFDLKRQCFDLNALKAARLRTDILPALVPSGTRIGSTSEGVPVFAALADNQASVLGSVRDIGKSLLVNIGTGGQISVRQSSYRTIAGLDLRPFPGGGYIAVGASLCGGKTYALLEHFFRDTCTQFMGAAPKDIYAIMNKLPADSAHPLTVDPRFAGTRLDASRRGAISGISMTNLTPGNLADGFLRGIAQELFDFYSLVPRETRGNISTLVGSGNGLRLNRRLRGLVEQIFGMRVNIPAHCEEAATGAALNAAVGAGFFDNYFEAGKTIKYE